MFRVRNRPPDCRLIETSMKATFEAVHCCFLSDDLEEGAYGTSVVVFS